MIVYVVNLDRAEQRMARMQALLEARGLVWRRIPAVDGRALSDETLDEWSIRHGDGERLLSPGEIGCLLSHREAWRLIVDSNEPGIVIEDDLHLSADAHELMSAAAWLPADADLVKIETTGKTVAVDRRWITAGAGHHLVRLRGAHLGTGGYIVTPGAARRLLMTITRCDRAIDHLLFDPQSPIFHSLVTYQLNPALCIQDQFLTRDRAGLDGEIERSWAIHKAPMPLHRKLARELRRLGQQIRAAIAGMPFGSVRNCRIPFPADRP